MKSPRLSRFAIMVVTILFLIFLASSGFGQSPTAGEAGKSPEVQAFDRKAMEKLQQMAPEDVEELDKRLAEALTLFYDREYAKALPIFQEISEKVETMDIMFWTASCAAKAGESEMAINKFQES